SALLRRSRHEPRESHLRPGDGARPAAAPPGSAGGPIRVVALRVKTVHGRLRRGHEDHEDHEIHEEDICFVASARGYPCPAAGRPRSSRADASMSAIVAHAVPAKELNWWRPYGNPLSKYGLNEPARLWTNQEPSACCERRR